MVILRYQVLEFEALRSLHLLKLSLLLAVCLLHRVVQENRHLVQSELQIAMNFLV